MIKTLLLALILCFTIGCKTNTKDLNVIYNDKTVSVWNNDSTLTNVDDIKRLSDYALRKLEYTCTNPRTFKPESVMIFREGDTLIISASGEASNSFNVPGTVSNFNKFTSRKELSEFLSSNGDSVLNDKIETVKLPRKQNDSIGG